MIEPNIAYEAITSLYPLTNKLKTSSFFCQSLSEKNLSPIDLFIENISSINVILSSSTEVSKELTFLALLGYVSAVESYLRALFREIINIDENSRKIVESKEITFGAVIFQKNKKLLPEALLEGISFSSSDNIKKSLTNFLGLERQLFSTMENYFQEFEKISQLRHCCTHRFGKLGSKNAIVLGLEEHSHLLECYIELNQMKLEEIADILLGFVKSLNNLIFKNIVDRTVKIGNAKNNIANTFIDWKWDYAQDRKTFAKFYKLFASKKDTVKSLKMKAIYDDFLIKQAKKV